jgi:Haloacid Dehalogenase superfamily, subfamily IB, phosphoserine phosphatase-like/2,3-diketo-5-methylthio-1-phosphopentane phosphatase
MPENADNQKLKLFLEAGNLDISACEVFFDFDNTITSYDVLDAIIEKFAVDSEWEVFEKAWSEGKIGSRECLKGQFRSLRATKDEMIKYVSGVKIDPYFSALLELLVSVGVEPIITSDSFTFVINQIFRSNGIKGIKVYANQLRFSGKNLIPVFPLSNPLCSKCAHCKKNRLLDSRSRSKILVYIGDGRSDRCPAQAADLVFAKGSLIRYCAEMNKPCVEFNDLSDVYNHLERQTNGTNLRKIA